MIKIYANRLIISVILTSFLVSGCNNEVSNEASLNDEITSSKLIANEKASDEVILASSETGVIATYTTEFTNDVPARNENIKLAAKNINDTILKPGDIFSFNKEVGPTGKKNGFKKARIFINGKESSGYGGGVCQVSSTVYNAALKADMEIVERHPHSKRVYYVPENKDAATSYQDGVDFQFKNNKDFAVKVQTICEETKVTVNILKA